LCVTDHNPILPNGIGWPHQPNPSLLLVYPLLSAALI
jgi:hypothetical protein